jgi:arylsulfatase A-like enzyme
VIAWPDHVPSGFVVEDRVRALDLHATLLELCGLRVPDGLESQSLVPLFGARAAPRRAIAEAIQRGPREIKSVIDGTHKLVVRGAQETLFDLARDPREMAAIAAPDAEAIARLRAVLREHRKCSEDGARRARALELAPDQQGAIQRLGYGGTVEETGRK